MRMRCARRRHFSNFDKPFPQQALENSLRDANVQIDQLKEHIKCEAEVFFFFNHKALVRNHPTGKGRSGKVITNTRPAIERSKNTVV